MPSVVTLIMILSVYPMTSTSMCCPCTCFAACFICIIGAVGSIRTESLTDMKIAEESFIVLALFGIFGDYEASTLHHTSVPSIADHGMKREVC